MGIEACLWQAKLFAQVLGDLERRQAEITPVGESAGVTLFAYQGMAQLATMAGNVAVAGQPFAPPALVCMPVHR